MSGSFIQRGGLWVLAQVVLILVVIVSGVAWRHQWQSAWSVFVGACLLLAGGVCGLAGVAALGRNLTAYPQPSLRARLVQTGIYRWIRHPIYTAGLCVLPGWSLVWQSWPALLAALAMGPLLDAKARREERWLRQRFPEYARYQAEVKRFLPWVY